jgi:hypothetical protein
MVHRAPENENAHVEVLAARQIADINGSLWRDNEGE